MKNKIWQKIIACLLSIVLIFTSVNPLLLFAYATDDSAIPTPTETPSPAPSMSPAPTIEPILTPTPEITATPIPSDTELLPTPTLAPTIDPSPTPIPEATQSASLSASTINDSTLDSTLSLDLNSANETGSATLTTDKPDYSPTETAIISGNDFTPNTAYTLIISSTDPPEVNFQTQIATDNSGGFIYNYQLDGSYRPNYKVQVKDLSGLIAATATFTDASGDSTAPTVALTYSANPAKAEAMTITATYSEAIVGTPKIWIDHPGISDIENAAMAGGPTIWTYLYIVNTANGYAYIDGVTTVSLSTVADPAGNNAQSPSGTTFTIDTTKPVIAAHATVTAEATSASGATVTYTANATDNIDATAPASCLPASGSAFAMGNTTVTCNKTDAAGNTATPTTFTVTVQDTTPPVIVLNGATPNVEINQSYTELGATATDAVDGTFAAKPTGLVNTTVVGSYTITYNATDAHSNSAAPITRTVNVIDSIRNTFTAISNDLDDNLIENNLNEVNTNNADNFSNLYFEKYDESGDAFGKLTFSDPLDLTDNDTITFLQNLGKELDMNQGRIAFDARDSAIFSATGATLEVYNMPEVTDSNLVVRDDSGNILDATDIVSNFEYDSDTQTVTFEAAHFTQFDIDTIAPVIASHAAVTAEATSVSGATVSYTAPNATDNIDATALASCSPVSGSAFSMGDTTVTCNKTDTAGNTAIPTTFTVTVQDTTKPTNVTAADSGTFTNNPHLTITWPASSDSGSGINYYKFYLNTAASHTTPVPLINGVNIGNVTTYTLTDNQAALLSDGVYYAKVRAVDNAGNSQGSGGNWSDGITLDTANPTISISSPANNALLNTPAVAISGTAVDSGSGIAKTEVSVDSGQYALAAGTTAWSFTTAVLSNGSHTLTAKTTDSSANTKTASITVTVDATAPDIPVVTTPAQPVNTATIHIIGTAEADSTVTITGGASTATGTATGGRYDITVTLTHNAVNNLSVTAKDAANNISSSATVAITHDDIAPAVTKLGNDSADVTIPAGATASLIFNGTLNSASKSAIQTALTNGANQTITYGWNNANDTLTITGHAANLTVFANDVVVSVSDAAGNTATNLLIIDSKLDAAQTTPDDSGAATSSAATSQVVITNPTQAATITINSTAVNPTIDVSSFIDGGTGTLPQITINSDSANVAIPATTVTSADSSWNGVIAAPTVTTVTLPETAGETKTLSTAIEIGFTGAKLSFDKAVRILLPGQAGKRAGYVRTGIAFTEITSLCPADSQAAGDALAVDGDCKIDVDLDLVIWTKHFTQFATYTQTANSPSSPSTGGGAGDGLSDGLGCASHDCSVMLTTTSQEQVSGTSLWPTVLAFTTSDAGPEILGTTSPEEQKTKVTQTQKNSGKVLGNEALSGKSPKSTLLKTVLETIIALSAIGSFGYWFLRIRKKV